MRTKNLFRTLAAAMLAVVSLSVSAQPTGYYVFGGLVDSTTVSVPVGAEVTDYVTVGSSMPYSITPDANFWNLIGDGTFNASGFFWRVATSVPAWATPGTHYNLTDTAAAALSDDPNTVDANYYLDSTVMVEWLQTGAYKVWHSEKSNSNTGGITGCEGVMSSLNVQVVNLPTIAWTDGVDLAAGGCGVDGTTINVQVNITGTDLWEVPVSATFKGLTGAAGVYNPAAVFTTPIAIGVSDIFTDGFANTENAVTLYALSIAAAEYGTWTFTIGGISDRISRKSLGHDAAFGASGGALVTDEFPVTTYKVYSLPTPTKKAIKHVTNLGW